MDLGSLTSSVQRGANALGALSSVASSPVATTAATPAATAASNGGLIGGISGGGLIALYVILRFTGLLPRWARII